MARQRKKTVREIAEEVLEKEKQQQGVTTMYGYPPYMMPPPIIAGGQPPCDPLSLHREIVKILEDQEKKAKESADKAKEKEKNKLKWPFNLQFSFLQTFMFCMVAGLPLGALQLALLSVLKNALLRTFQ